MGRRKFCWKPHSLNDWLEAIIISECLEYFGTNIFHRIRNDSQIYFLAITNKTFIVEHNAVNLPVMVDIITFHYATHVFAPESINLTKELGS